MTNNQLLQSLHQPQSLERLYQKNPAQFSFWLDEALAIQPDSETLNVWHARLNFTEDLNTKHDKKPLFFIIILSLLAGFLVKLPEILPLTENWYYPRFVPIIVISALSIYFLHQGSSKWSAISVLGGLAFCITLMLLIPHRTGSSSILMSLIHMPLVLLSLLSIAFLSNDWKSPEKRLHYIRYLGELIIYTTLILLGGFVLSVLTIELFFLIGLTIGEWYSSYIVILGLVAAPIVATYIYDALFDRKSTIATVISNIFSPLFTITVCIYLGAIAYQGKTPFEDRDFLITINGLLVIVWAISVFSLSGLRHSQTFGLLDKINIILLSVTLLINTISLSAIVFRLSEYGVTPNRVAVTGVNILIFIHLLLILKEYLHQFFTIRNNAQLVKTVSNYLPLYALWSVFIVLILPVLVQFE